MAGLKGWVRREHHNCFMMASNRFLVTAGNAVHTVSLYDMGNRLLAMGIGGDNKSAFFDLRSAIAHKEALAFSGVEEPKIEILEFVHVENWVRAPGVFIAQK